MMLGRTGLVCHFCNSAGKFNKTVNDFKGVRLLTLCDGQWECSGFYSGEPRCCTRGPSAFCSKAITPRQWQLCRAAPSYWLSVALVLKQKCLWKMQGLLWMNSLGSRTSSSISRFSYNYIVDEDASTKHTSFSAPFTWVQTCFAV